MENIEKMVISTLNGKIELDNSFPFKIEYIKEKYFHGDSETFGLVVKFILKAVTVGALGAIGKEIYEKIKNIIKKHINESKDSKVSFEINYKDYSAKFIAENIKSKTVDNTLDSFNKQLDKIDFNKLQQLDNKETIFIFRDKDWVISNQVTTNEYWKKKIDEINESELDMEK